MNLLLPTYKMTENPPSIDFDGYANRIHEQLHAMLNNRELSESKYQEFFEKNPCMLPGFNQGNPSHGAHFFAVVSQPVIEGQVERRPDFMWLLETSLELVPVFIEIEKPSKTLFRVSDEVQNAKFTQACEQITEWKALLAASKARGHFYDRYGISERGRGLTFSPRYILVYGRRDEYYADQFLTNKRSEKQTSDFDIVSFDRLNPSRDAMHYGTVKVRSDGTVQAICIPPTFQLGPSIAEDVANWNDFNAAADASEDMPDARRRFLKQRYEYWCNWAKGPNKSAFETGVWE